MRDAKRLKELLDLDREPVAIAFESTAPEGLARIDASAASGCTYWRLAAEGQSFFTEAADHYGCPIGAHTHGVEMPAEVAEELNTVVGTMVELQYISMDEVPQIPQMAGPFGVAIYAPLHNAEFEPDVVLVSGNAKQMMLLAESVHAAGLSCDTSMVGRPTCAAIPASMQAGRAAANLGCIGNRVYTQAADEDLYIVIPGAEVGAVVAKLETIANANNALESYHRDRAG